MPEGVGCASALRLLSLATSVLLLLSALGPALPARRGGKGAALMLARRLPPALAAAAMLLLDGLFQSTRDTNHRWQLPSLFLAALALDDPAKPSPSAREVCIAAAGGMWAARCVVCKEAPHGAEGLHVSRFGAAAWSKLTISSEGVLPTLAW